MKIETERLILRDIEKSDSKSIRENINNLNVSKYLATVPYPYAKKDAEWWINHCVEERKGKNRTSYDFGIVIKPNKDIVGGIGLIKIDYFQGTAEIGYWIAENYWRQGYVSEAVASLIKFAFSRLQLRRLNLPAFVENEGSNGLAKKLGFIYEGTLRKSCKAKSTGKVHDENIYSLLKEEWKKLK